MSRARLLGVAIACAGCGQAQMVAPMADAPVTTACTQESDCAAPTPYCEPSSGTCVACRFSSHCAASGRVCEANSCVVAETCAALKAELPALASGVYTIDVDGTGAIAPFDTFCDMTTDGGGWTLVQRTRWQWAQSQALHTDYLTWHDTTIGTPEPASAFRLAGVRWPDLDGAGGLMVVHRVRTANGGACNPLYYVASGATVMLDATGKTATLAGITQPVGIAASMSLSTKDSGPDASVSNGVPWFYNGCCSTCPTYQGGYWADEPHPMVAYTASQADFFAKTEANVCSGQAVRTADIPPFSGVDSMEVYLR